MEKVTKFYIVKKEKNETKLTLLRQIVPFCKQSNALN